LFFFISMFFLCQRFFCIMPIHEQISHTLVFLYYNVSFMLMLIFYIHFISSIFVLYIIINNSLNRQSKIINVSFAIGENFKDRYILCISLYNFCYFSSSRFLFFKIFYLLLNELWYLILCTKEIRQEWRN
jgi:hypothetical protein